MGAETVEREIQYLQGSTVLGQADLASLGSYENHIGAVIQTDSGRNCTLWRDVTKMMQLR